MENRGKKAWEASLKALIKDIRNIRFSNRVFFSLFIVIILIITLLPKYSFVNSQSNRIWTDKSTYCIGENVIIYYETPLTYCGTSFCIYYIDIILVKPNGEEIYLVKNEQGGGRGSTTGMAGYPPGTRTVKLVNSGTVADSKTFDVKDCSGSQSEKKVIPGTICGKIEKNFAIGFPDHFRRCDGITDYIMKTDAVGAYFRITDPIYENVPCEFSYCWTIVGWANWQEISSCDDCTTNPCSNHCSNGIQDCGESGVDCGGECSSCQQPCDNHCSNGIQDCGESGVDCGGECSPCQQSCTIDSDNDGINDCNDKCSNTPELLSKNLSVDSDGCIICLDKEARCGVSISFLISFPGPTFGIPSIIIDFCEIIASFLQGKLEGLAQKIVRLISDIIFAIVRILSTAVAPGVGDKVIGALQTLLGCLPEIDSSDVRLAYDDAIQKIKDADLNNLSVYVGSPVFIEIRDDHNNILNEYNKTGISNSYLLNVGETKIALIANPLGNYRIETKGTAEGTYDLKIVTTSNGQITASKEYDNVKTSVGQVNTYNVNVEQSGKVIINEGESFWKRLLKGSPFAQYGTKSLLLIVFLILGNALILLYSRKRR